MDDEQGYPYDSGNHRIGIQGLQDAPAIGNTWKLPEAPALAGGVANLQITCTIKHNQTHSNTI